MTELRTVRVAAVQATPVVLDADATVAKACRLLAEAAEGTGDAGRERMFGAFMASSEHELAFWDSAFSAGAATS